MKQNHRGEYPLNWNEIAAQVKADAGNRCIRCGHANEFETGYVLTVHHLDGDKSNCRWWNMAALCQRCHLRIQGRYLWSACGCLSILNGSNHTSPDTMRFTTAYPMIENTSYSTSQN